MRLKNGTKAIVDVLLWFSPMQLKWIASRIEKCLARIGSCWMSHFFPIILNAFTSTLWLKHAEQRGYVFWDTLWCHFCPILTQSSNNQQKVLHKSSFYCEFYNRKFWKVWKKGKTLFVLEQVTFSFDSSAFKQTVTQNHTVSSVAWRAVPQVSRSTEESHSDTILQPVTGHCRKSA